MVLNIIHYFKLRHDSRLVFKPSYPKIDHSVFWDVIGKISLRLQWRQSSLMHHSQEGKIGIYICS